jgi:hypothetical protein
LDCTARSTRAFSIDAGSSSIEFALYDLPLEIDLINAVGVSQFLVRFGARRSASTAHREGE